MPALDDRNAKLFLGYYAETRVLVARGYSVQNRVKIVITG